MPAGVPLDRQRAVYTITIYRAEDLPRTDFGIFASMRNAIALNKVAFIDAFVKVSFVGHIVSTDYHLRPLPLLDIMIIYHLHHTPLNAGKDIIQEELQSRMEGSFAVHRHVPSTVQQNQDSNL